MHQHLQRKHIAPVPPRSTPQDLEIPQLPHMVAVQHQNQYSKYVPPAPLPHQNRPSPPSGPQHHHPSSPSHYSYMYHYKHSQPGSPSKPTTGSHPHLYQQYSVPDPNLQHYQKYVAPPAPSNAPNIQHHYPPYQFHQKQPNPRFHTPAPTHLLKITLSLCMVFGTLNLMDHPLHPKFLQLHTYHTRMPRERPTGTSVH